MKPGFHNQLDLRLDWADLDVFGHVNNIAYFRFVQSSRIAFLNCINLFDFYEQENIGPILLSCKCDFKKPLQYPGSIRCHSQLEFLGNSSFGLQHEIIDLSDNVIAAEAHDVIVLYDFQKGKSTTIPDDLRSRFEAVSVE